MVLAFVAVAAALLGDQCAPAPALCERNQCRAYDNACAGKAGYGGLLKSVPTVDASRPDFMTSLEFISAHVEGRQPLLIKNASQLFLHHPELFTHEALLQSPLADDWITTTSSGREVTNREHFKKATEPLSPLRKLFEGDKRTVFFQAWHVKEDGELGGAASHVDDNYRLSKPEKFTVAGDQSFSVSSYAFAHVRHDHGLFTHQGAFNFLMANEGGVLPHSHAAVLNVLTQGAKRWTLVAPSAYKTRDEQTQFEDWKDTGIGTKYLSSQWYTDKAAEIKNAHEHYDFVQEQGDAVFFPEGYTHATVDLCSPTIAFIQKGQFTKYWHPDPRAKRQHGRLRRHKDELARARERREPVSP